MNPFDAPPLRRWLNFGALIAFAAVTAVVLVRSRFCSGERVMFPVLVRVPGIAIGSFIWWNLMWKAQRLGAAWLCAGALTGWAVQQCVWPRLAEADIQQ